MNFVIDTLPYGQNVTPSEVIDFDKKKKAQSMVLNYWK